MSRHTSSPPSIRKFSRRDFMQLALAAGLTVPLADRLWAQETAERKRGGHFKIGLGQGATTDVLDPSTFMDFMPGTVCASYANFLTEVDADGNITPDLAESFEGSNGAKTWVFKLRTGVQFHNGRALKPEDVVASIRHHLGPESKSAVKAQLSAIEEIKVDDGAVVFSLATGNADLPYLLSDYHLPIFPAKEDGTMDWQAGIGTGPYTLESWQPGISAKLKRNPNYYRDTWFDEVEILSIVDVAARMNALVTGDLHFADRCDLKTLDLLKRNPNIEIDEVTGFAHATFSMDITQAPFDNPDVRNALKHAVDRDAILSKIFFGHGIAGNDNPIAPSIKFATNPEPVHTYDPGKARELLKKAGLDGLKVDLSAADTAFAGAVDAALLFKDSAAAAGIEINVIREPNDAYWETVWGKKPFIAS
ncbi:MAG: ABC transporter substrate-binding protein, partial [Parvibaculaceae bacterium]